MLNKKVKLLVNNKLRFKGVLTRLSIQESCLIVMYQDINTLDESIETFYKIEDMYMEKNFITFYDHQNNSIIIKKL